MASSLNRLLWPSPLFLYISLFKLAFVAADCSTTLELDLFRVSLLSNAQVITITASSTVTITGSPPVTVTLTDPEVCTTTVTNVFDSEVATDPVITITPTVYVAEPSASPSQCTATGASFTNFYLMTTAITDSPSGPNNVYDRSIGSYANLVYDSYPDNYYTSYGTKLLTFNVVTTAGATIFTINADGRITELATGFRTDVEDGIIIAVMYWDSPGILVESAGSYDEPSCQADSCSPYGTTLSCDAPLIEDKNIFVLCSDVYPDNPDPLTTNGYLYLTQHAMQDPDDGTLANCTAPITLVMVDADGVEEG